MSQKPLTEFSQTVVALIQKVPKGKVATYAQIAKLAGRPRAIRRVVWLLHSCSQTHQLPWHRILNSKGEIAFDVGTANYKKQKKELMAEGIKFDESGQINLARFLWKKKTKTENADWNTMQSLTKKL